MGARREKMVRACIQGLASKPELNGTLCEALEIDAGTGRQVVRLADGSKMKLKPANLQLFTDDDGEPQQPSQSPSRPSAAAGDQMARRPGQGENFQPTWDMFLPTMTPKRMLFVAVWIFGILLMLYAPAPIQASEEAQDKYETLLAKAGTMRSAIVAENELIAASRHLADGQGITFLWRLSASSRAEVAKRQAGYDGKKRVFDQKNGERMALVRQAKNAVGLWSEYGIGEVRDTFWKAVDEGKAFAKRMSWWDAMFLGAGAMFGGRRGEDGAGQLISYVLQMIGRILLNFTMGFVGAFFYFVYALFNLVFSYEPDAITGTLFFCVAFFAASSMIAAVIFGMYAGTAATIGGIAYIAIKNKNAQLEYNRRNPERLRGGRQQQYGGGGRRPHYE